MEKEEEDLSSNPNQTPNHLDESRQRKHVALLKWLTNHHQTGLENSPNHRSSDSDSSSSAPSFKSTSSLPSRFADSRRSIESRIAQCRLTPTSESPQLKPQLESISASISDLDKLVAENSYFLPSYEVRSSLKSISDLRQSDESLILELVPKKKFTQEQSCQERESSSL